MESIWDNYDFIEKEMIYLVESSIRAKALLALGDSKKTRDELKSITSATSPALSTKLNDMIKRGFIRQEDNNYTLTPYGRLIEPYVRRFVLIGNIAKKFKDWWIEHKIEYIPQEFIDNLHLLDKIEIIENTPDDNDCVQRKVKEFIEKGKGLVGMSPSSNITWMKLVIKQLQKGNKVRIVVSKKVIESYKKIPLLMPLFKKIINKDKNTLKWVDNLPLGVGVNDHGVIIGLVDETGMMDLRKMFYSDDKNAIKWAKEICEYYQKIAKPI
jgi:predicted transcriptional regulator